MTENDHPLNSTNATEDIEPRLRRVERVIEALSREVHTRRLVVSDPGAHARIVAEALPSGAELRAELLRPSAVGSTSVVVFAMSDDSVEAISSSSGLGPFLGIQLWCDGNSVIELEAWMEADGRWHPQVRLPQAHHRSDQSPRPDPE